FMFNLLDVMVFSNHSLDLVVFFFLILRLPPRSTLFPYTTLFRSTLAYLTVPTTDQRNGIFGRPIKNPYTGEIYSDGVIPKSAIRSEEHTSELQSRGHLVCRLLLEKKKKIANERWRETTTQTTAQR